MERRFLDKCKLIFESSKQCFCAANIDLCKIFFKPTDVVKSFLTGEGGAKLLALQWSVPKEKICTWVSHYRLHGFCGLRPKRNAYSAQFKLQVLSHQDREQLSSRQVEAVYDIRYPNQVVVWRRNLDEGGVEALRSMKQRPPSMKPVRSCSAPPRAVKKWVTDITEFNVNGQMLYLSALTELYNGKIIAH